MSAPELRPPANLPSPKELQKIRAAVFDFGGVLIEGGPSDVRAFGARVGLDTDQWRGLRLEIFANDSPWAKLERGEISYDAFLDHLTERVSAAGGTIDRTIAQSFMGVPDPLSKQKRLRPAMLEAVARLRTVMPTALLTNNIREWRDGWHKIMDVPRLFTETIDSSDVGARKPEPAIYEITREKLAVQHDEIFFIDDIGQNLKAARALGWHTVLFDEEAEVLKVLDALYEANADRAATSGGGAS
jgi:putative hydrolase of the HAD superfamily